ncbi:hypothetical protein JCM3765_002042 [Sporobolomyces pararoseus]
MVNLRKVQRPAPAAKRTSTTDQHKNSTPTEEASSNSSSTPAIRQSDNQTSPHLSNDSPANSSASLGPSQPPLSSPSKAASHLLPEFTFPDEQSSALINSAPSPRFEEESSAPLFSAQDSPPIPSVSPLLSLSNRATPSPVNEYPHFHASAETSDSSSPSVPRPHRSPEHSLPVSTAHSTSNSSLEHEQEQPQKRLGSSPSLADSPQPSKSIEFIATRDSTEGTSTTEGATGSGEAVISEDGKEESGLIRENPREGKVGKVEKWSFRKEEDQGTEGDDEMEDEDERGLEGSVERSKERGTGEDSRKEGAGAFRAISCGREDKEKPSGSPVQPLAATRSDAKRRVDIKTGLGAVSTKKLKTIQPFNETSKVSISSRKPIESSTSSTFNKASTPLHLHSTTKPSNVKQRAPPRPSTFTAPRRSTSKTVTTPTANRWTAEGKRQSLDRPLTNRECWRLRQILKSSTKQGLAPHDHDVRWWEDPDARIRDDLNPRQKRIILRKLDLSSRGLSPDTGSELDEYDNTLDYDPESDSNYDPDIYDSIPLKRWLALFD